MQVPKLKVLVEAGAVRQVEAIPEADGWAVQVTYASRAGERREVLERQRGGARGFATLDAVARAVAGAGLSAFQVHVAGLPGAGEKNRREPGPAAGPAGLAGAGGGLGGVTRPGLHPGLPSGGGGPAQRHRRLPAADPDAAGAGNTPRSTSARRPARAAPPRRAATPPPATR